MKTPLATLATFIAIVFLFAEMTTACPLRNDSAVAAEDKFDAAAMQGSILKVVEKVYPTAVSITDANFPGGFSGVIVSKDGLVLSAAHAIEPGLDYTVHLHDGREVMARGLGREPNVDCAMLKIMEAGDWPVAELGWSFDLKENQPCVSISHPGELNSDRGPVVRFGRIADPSSGINGFIKSSCLMEPGDSGGPLFDMNGRVIGIHSMIQESEEENYDVPIDAFRRFWPELIIEKTFRSRSVDRGPMFGLKLIRSRDASGRQLESQPIGGVRIFKVEEDSTASRAGLERNDRIVQINSQRVLSSYEIENLFFGLYARQRKQIELTIDRDGKQFQVQLAVPEIDTDDGALTSDNESEFESIKPIPELATLESAFSDIESRLDDFSAQVTSRRNDETSRGMATILSNSGLPQAVVDAIGEGNLLIAKNSLVTDSPVATLEDSRRVSLEVVARDMVNDLVLLRSSTSLGPGMDLTVPAASDIDEPGEFLISPHPRNEGSVSVVGSPLFQSDRLESSGFFGVLPEIRDGQVVLVEVIADHAAKKAGFRRGDVILTINNRVIHTREELSSILSEYLPGDEVTVKAIRDDEPIEKTVLLGIRPDPGVHVAEDFDGGKSERRDGFEEVFVQGAIVKPRECGGPVFDINGTFRGINIARFSRTRCYVLPARIVKKFVDDNAGMILQ